MKRDRDDSDFREINESYEHRIKDFLPYEKRKDYPGKRACLFRIRPLPGDYNTREKLDHFLDTSKKRSRLFYEPASLVITSSLL